MSTPRRYLSPVREQRAADTRDRIVTAARDLFAADGLAGATMTAIAERAGVAAPTVYATFGSKPELLRAVLTQTEEQAHAADWSARIGAAPDPADKLTLFAHWSAELFGASHDLIIAVHRGAGAGELIADGERHRRDGLQPVIESLSEAGALKPGLGIAGALDRAWILTGPETYLLAVHGCGWTRDHYQTWLSTLLRDQLLADA